MPISYSSILEEHDAVRKAIGLFDLSHMGQIVVSGPGADEWLDGLTTNEVTSMSPNQARYNIFANERGGALDDTIIYRLPQHWLVVVNASNTQKMWEWLSSQTPRVSLRDRTRESALIAVQGPKAVSLLAAMGQASVAGLKNYHATRGAVAGVDAEIARTGYTGEDGFELFVAADDARKLWDRLLAEGERFGLLAAGLGARDVLRLEAGMPLYGHELGEDITPLQAGLDWAVKFDKPRFVGRQALLDQKRRGGYDRISGLVMAGKAPARSGYAVLHDGTRVGEVKSGSPAPSLGGKNIATALLKETASLAGTLLEVEIRGQRHGCSVVQQPFYKRPKAASGDFGADSIR